MACFDWVRWPMQIMGVLVTPIRNAANTPTDEPSRVSSPPRWGQTQKCEPKHAELRSTVRGGPIMAHCRYIWIAMFPDFVFVTKSRVNSSSIKKKSAVCVFCFRFLHSHFICLWLYRRRKGHGNCVALKYTCNTTGWAKQNRGYALSKLENGEQLKHVYWTLDAQHAQNSLWVGLLKRQSKWNFNCDYQHEHTYSCMTINLAVVLILGTAVVHVML